MVLHRFIPSVVAILVVPPAVAFTSSRHGGRPSLFRSIPHIASHIPTSLRVLDKLSSDLLTTAGEAENDQSKCPLFDVNDSASIIRQAQKVAQSDFGLQDPSLLSRDSFVWIGPNADDLLGFTDYIAAGRFFNVRSAFPDLDYRVHDMRFLQAPAGAVSPSSMSTKTVYLTCRTTGTMRGELRLRSGVFPPTGVTMLCPPEGVVMQFDVTTGLVTKLVTGMVLDRLVGNTDGTCGMAAASAVAGEPTSVWERLPVSTVLGSMLRWPIREKQQAFLSPFPESVMVQLAKSVMFGKLGAIDPTLLRDNFRYSTPIVGPVGKTEYLKKYAETEMEGLDPNYANFRVDRYDPARVWVDYWPTSGSGEFVGPPQCMSLTFDEKGSCTKLTAAAVLDPSVGNGGGLGGQEGYRYARGTASVGLSTRPLPRLLGRLSKRLSSPITGIGADEYAVRTTPESGRIQVATRQLLDPVPVPPPIAAVKTPIERIASMTEEGVQPLPYALAEEPPLPSNRTNVLAAPKESIEVVKRSEGSKDLAGSIQIRQLDLASLQVKPGAGALPKKRNLVPKPPEKRPKVPPMTRTAKQSKGDRGSTVKRQPRTKKTVSKPRNSTVGPAISKEKQEVARSFFVADQSSGTKRVPVAKETAAFDEKQAQKDETEKKRVQAEQVARQKAAEKEKEADLQRVEVSASERAAAEMQRKEEDAKRAASEAAAEMKRIEDSKQKAAAQRAASEAAAEMKRVEESKQKAAAKRAASEAAAEVKRLEEYKQKADAKRAASEAAAEAQRLEESKQKAAKQAIADKLQAAKEAAAAQGKEKAAAAAEKKKKAEERERALKKAKIATEARKQEAVRKRKEEKERKEAVARKRRAKSAERTISNAAPSATVGLFGMGKQNLDKLPALPRRAATKLVNKRAPKGVPTVSRWRLKSNKSITGIVSGSPNFDDGMRISTSPVKSGTVAPGEIVKTGSGSRYFLE